LVTYASSSRLSIHDGWVSAICVRKVYYIDGIESLMGEKIESTKALVANNKELFADPPGQRGKIGARIEYSNTRPREIRSASADGNAGVQCAA